MSCDSTASRSVVLRYVVDPDYKVAPVSCLMSVKSKYIELTVVLLTVICIALGLTVHAPAFVPLAAVFGLISAGLRIGSLLDD